MGIDTIRCAAVGHRGTGGGGGEEQGGIVGEGEENILRETLCTSAGRDRRWVGKNRAGEKKIYNAKRYVRLQVGMWEVCEYVHIDISLSCVFDSKISTGN